MGIISEIIEGIVTGIVKLIKVQKSSRRKWEKLNHLSVPSWVEKASHKFHNKHPVKHHDLRKDFFGNHYHYRVIYKKAAYGRVVEEFYRKKK